MSERAGWRGTVTFVSGAARWIRGKVKELLQ